MAWMKVVIPKGDLALQGQGAFLTQIEHAARVRNIVGAQLHRAQLSDGSFEFFLESPFAELIDQAKFGGMASGQPPPEAELITL